MRELTERNCATQKHILNMLKVHDAVKEKRQIINKVKQFGKNSPQKLTTRMKRKLKRLKLVI